MTTGFEKLGIGPDKPPKLILDFCWNHEGSIGRVRQMLEALRRTLYTEVGNRSLFDLIIPKFQAGRDLPWDRAHYRGVKKMCEEEFGLPFLCTAFDYKAVDMLVSIGVEAVKIGSAEAADLDFVRYAAGWKPLFISTGGLQPVKAHSDGSALFAATLMRSDFISLYDVVLNLDPKPVLMYCLSEYPATAEHLALESMRFVTAVPPYPECGGRYSTIYSGYSSHYPEITDAIFAMALGAQVIEKHYSLTPGGSGDHAVSINEMQARVICQYALDWHKMRGYTKSPATLEAERALLKPFRERFYAGNHNQADRNPGQDQVPGSDARRLDSELS